MYHTGAYCSFLDSQIVPIQIINFNFKAIYGTKIFLWFRFHGDVSFSFKTLREEIIYPIKLMICFAGVFQFRLQIFYWNII